MSIARLEISATGTAYLRYANQRCCCCIKKLVCYKSTDPVVLQDFFVNVKSCTGFLARADRAIGIHDDWIFECFVNFGIILRRIEFRQNGTGNCAVQMDVYLLLTVRAHGNAVCAGEACDLQKLRHTACTGRIRIQDADSLRIDQIPETIAGTFIFAARNGNGTFGRNLLVALIIQNGQYSSTCRENSIAS